MIDGPGTDRRHRRPTAWRDVTWVLSRIAAEHRISDRLAGLAAYAGSVYDLDDRVDVYSDGIVGELERRTARTLGMEAPPSSSPPAPWPSRSHCAAGRAAP